MVYSLPVLPEGLETTIRTLKNLCQDNMAVRDLIDLALKKEAGRPPAEKEILIETPKKKRGRPPKPKFQPEPEKNETVEAQGRRFGAMVQADELLVLHVCVSPEMVTSVTTYVT